MRGKMKKTDTKGGNVITHNAFYGIRWDAQATEAVVIIAKALQNLTELFIAQNIKIGPLLQIGTDEEDEADERCYS